MLFFFPWKTQALTCSFAPLSLPPNHLNRNSLNGTMPHEIWELPALQSLNLKENELFVHFTNINKAKKLELLYISDIDIGNIDGIGYAPALTEL